MTVDPADLARPPNADYERGVRDGRAEIQARLDNVVEYWRTRVANADEYWLTRVANADRDAEKAKAQLIVEREGWRKAKEAALVEVDRHYDICDEECYCPCANKIESAIRRLPEEPPKEGETK